MCKYLIGDVVWCIVPYSDGLGTKFRPAIVLKISESPCRYLLAECSTFKTKHKLQKGIFVAKGSLRASECGFDEDTFITENKCWLAEHRFKPHPIRGDNPIGKCNFMDEVMKI